MIKKFLRRSIKKVTNSLYNISSLKNKKMEELLQEFNKWNSFKERNLIKPFSSLKEIYLLLYDDEFISTIHKDKKFFKFVRKKIFWVLDKNEEDYLVFKGLRETENDELILILTDQILLNYFEKNLTFLNLCNI